MPFFDKIDRIYRVLKECNDNINQVIAERDMLLTEKQSILKALTEHRFQDVLDFYGLK